MKDQIEAIRIEILFNSVEIELSRRCALHNVPAPFLGRPDWQLRLVVKAWWHLYHEAACASQRRNRTVWERNPAYPAMAMDTATLGAGLLEISRLLDLRELVTYRLLTKSEVISISQLRLLIRYYANLNTERCGQML